MFHLAGLLRDVAPSRRPRPTVALTALVADTSGVAALELSLSLPFMILLMMGVYDFGTYAYDTMQVSAAAYAGAEAAVAAAQNHQACTNAVITTAEQSATSLGASIATTNGLTGTAFKGPNCAYNGYVSTISGQSALSQNSCLPNATTCAGPGAYAVAYAQVTYAPLLSWSGLVLPNAISTTATVRYG